MSIPTLRAQIACARTNLCRTISSNFTRTYSPALCCRIKCARNNSRASLWSVLLFNVRPHAQTLPNHQALHMTNSPTSCRSMAVQETMEIVLV